MLKVKNRARCVTCVYEMHASQKEKYVLCLCVCVCERYAYMSVTYLTKKFFFCLKCDNHTPKDIPRPGIEPGSPG